jgi:hypothetical protein
MNDRPETRRRVTVPDAADALGITVEAVRGRIKRGKLGHVKDGGTVYVLLPIDRTRPDTTSHQPDNDRITDQSKLIEVLEAQVEDLRARLDRAEEANRENRRLLAAAFERIPPQLEAPRETRDAPQGAAEASEGAEPRSDGAGPQRGAQGHSNMVERPAEETPRRPWWARIFWG